MNSTVEDLTAWLESVEEKNPLFEINKALREGTMTYREYLKKIANLTNHFCDTVGFVPSDSLAGIIQDKLYRESLTNNVSTVVSRLTNGIMSIPSVAEDDDFI